MLVGEFLILGVCFICVDKMLLVCEKFYFFIDKDGGYVVCVLVLWCDSVGVFWGVGIVVLGKMLLIFCFYIVRLGDIVGKINV